MNCYLFHNRNELINLWHISEPTVNTTLSEDLPGNQGPGNEHFDPVKAEAGT